MRRRPAGCGAALGPGRSATCGGGGLYAGPESYRLGARQRARGGRTQRPRRRRRCPRPRARSRALSSYAAKMAEALRSCRCERRAGPGAGRTRPPAPPAALRRRGPPGRASPPARRPLSLAARAAPRLPAAGRGERSGSGRSPNRSMALAGRRRQTRSPRAAAAASTPGGSSGGGSGGSGAVAARAPSITQRRAGTPPISARRGPTAPESCARASGRRRGGAVDLTPRPPCFPGSSSASCCALA